SPLFPYTTLFRAFDSLRRSCKVFFSPRRLRINFFAASASNSTPSFSHGISPLSSGIASSWGAVLVERRSCALRDYPTPAHFSATLAREPSQYQRQIWIISTPAERRSQA